MALANEKTAYGKKMQAPSANADWQGQSQRPMGYDAASIPLSAAANQDEVLDGGDGGDVEPGHWTALLGRDLLDRILGKVQLYITYGAARSNPTFPNRVHNITFLSCKFALNGLRDRYRMDQNGEGRG
jgi:hypothetical protein